MKGRGSSRLVAKVPMVKDFYEVLGVQASDDLAVIKQRYRQLVRQYHPDIATNREAAHEMMLAINEAWTILSDPAERARYDRSRQTSAPPPAAAASPNPRVDTWVGGGGRSTPAARPAPAPARPAARGSSTTRTRLLTMVFEAAELYFFQGRAAEAIEVCRRVMKYDANNAEAPALLGDIYSEQGKKDDAIAMYELAVRNQPSNMLYQQKLAALQGTVSPRSRSEASKPGSGFGGNVSGVGAYTANVSAAGAGVREDTVSRAGRKKMAAAAKAARRAAKVSSNGYDEGSSSYGPQDSRRVVAGFLLMALALGIVWWGISVPASTLQVQVSTVFGFELFMATVIGAFLVGIALPLLGVVNRCGRMRRGEPSWLGTPFIIALAVAGAFISPAAFGLFLIVTLIRGSWNFSIFTVMAVACAWSVILASSGGHSPATQQLILTEALMVWSGRAIFPAMLLGWYLGSRGSRY